ncbi:HNH endonuclease signature motif containing protein [Peribacillus butanolivorans]
MPKKFGGTDEFGNLRIVHKYVHRLIHAKKRLFIIGLFFSWMVNN